MNETDPNRFAELEMRLAFLEKNQEESNQAAYEQDKIIAQLRKEVTTLQQRLTQMSESASGAGGEEIIDEPPPHY